MIVPRLSLLAVASLALLTSCRKPTVESYRVPKEAAAPVPAGTADNAPASAAPFANAAPGGSPMASTPVATASGAGLAWIAPANWAAKPGSAMRKGSYTVKADGVAGEGDLSITAFPGDVGGDLANLNRWRGQIQLPPVTPAELEASVQRLERNSLKLTVVDLAALGGNGQRILGAMIPYGGATWFFKLMGPDALLAKEKSNFTAFLETVKPAAGAP